MIRVSLPPRSPYPRHIATSVLHVQHNHAQTEAHATLKRAMYRCLPAAKKNTCKSEQLHCQVTSVWLLKHGTFPSKSMKGICCTSRQKHSCAPRKPVGHTGQGVRSAANRNWVCPGQYTHTHTHTHARACAHTQEVVPEARVPVR